MHLTLVFEFGLLATVVSLTFMYILCNKFKCGFTRISDKIKSSVVEKVKKKKKKKILHS